jgi:hypothetical protein
MNKTLVFALSLVLGCTTTQSSTPPAAQSEFKNLQVLPKNISHDELIETMRGFTRSLGVKCGACHVVTATEPKMEFDFPNDSKEEKRIARVMIQMTQQINGAWLERVEAAEAVKGEEAKREALAGAPEEPVRVSCWTCHRGKEEPEMPPPPPPAAAP